MNTNTPFMRAPMNNIPPMDNHPRFNPFVPLPLPNNPVNYITNFNFNFNGEKLDGKNVSVKMENGEYKFDINNSKENYRQNYRYNHRHNHRQNVSNDNHRYNHRQNVSNNDNINKLEELILNELLGTFGKSSDKSADKSVDKSTDNKPSSNIGKNVIPPFNNIKPNIRVIPINGNMGGSLDELFSGMFKPKDNKLKVLDAPILAENIFDISKDYDTLPFEVKDLDGLILLADLYDKNNPHQFGINMKRLNLIKSSLENLKNIIGMENVKKKIFEKIISFLQGLGNVDDMNHIMIVGPPGHGKTKLAFHLSEIFYKMGIIKKIESDEEPKEYYHPFTNEKLDFPFIIARRKDLVGEYVGHTSPKVTNMVKKALGGVLFIDEAYDIGKKDNSRDSFSEEAINALNQAMSEYGGQFILMIAGYKEMIKEQFMVNPGMERRFRMIFEIEKYKTEELTDILEQMINKAKYNKDKDLSKDKLIEFVKDNEKHFVYSGGDLEIVLQNTIEQHSIRVLGQHPKDKRFLTLEDFKNGVKEFIKNRDNKKLPEVYRHMFV
jgi:stage V sporulation protein K